MSSSVNSSKAKSQGSAISNGLAIRMVDVGKKYQIYTRPSDQLKDILLKRFGVAIGHEFWALRHINIEIERGEIVGVIGRNGSGKSTLLQIISEILPSSEGVLRINGRVGAILELGCGFNPNFTGRENVYISGAIHGIARKDINRRFEEISEFADIGEFMDQPVKVYSSGMLARLAYAVQTCIEPDILIVDEALAVGDIFFQQKCSQHIRHLANNGATILLVSHNMNVVRNLCGRALLLHQGTQRYFGASSETVRRYYEIQPGMNEEADSSGAPLSIPHPDLDHLQDFFLSCQWTDAARSSAKEARILGVSIRDGHGAPAMAFCLGAKAAVLVLAEALQDGFQPGIALSIRDRFDRTVFASGTLTKNIAISRQKRGGRFWVEFELELGLEAGEYTMVFAVSDVASASANQARNVFLTSPIGPVNIEWDYEKQRAPFIGAFNLPCRIAAQED